MGERATLIRGHECHTRLLVLGCRLWTATIVAMSTVQLLDVDWLDEGRAGRRRPRLLFVIIQSRIFEVAGWKIASRLILDASVTRVG